MVDSLITKDGKKTLLYRGYTATADLSATQYLAPSQFQVGVDNAAMDISDTSLTNPIPISDGTVCDDGSNTFTGSSGGDNSTDNTSTYKEGAGVTDATAQNLIANDTNATKKWEIADLTSAGVNADAAKYIAQWHYIKDAATLAKYKTSGTCLEIRIGVDTTTNYYSQVWTAADLAVGWNWLCDNGLLSSWDVNGTPGTLNNFAIIITTNNATDEFVAGDVVYDLLRQWEAADMVKDFQTGYPIFDFDKLEVTTRCYLNALEANGFLIDSLGQCNKDTSKLMTSEDNYSGQSKSSTDEFAYISVDSIL